MQFLLPKNHNILGCGKSSRKNESSSLLLSHFLYSLGSSKAPRLSMAFESLISQGKWHYRNRNQSGTTNSRTASIKRQLCFIRLAKKDNFMLKNWLSIQGLNAQHENGMTHIDLLNWFMYGEYFSCKVDVVNLMHNFQCSKEDEKKGAILTSCIIQATISHFCTPYHFVMVSSMYRFKRIFHSVLAAAVKQ